MATHTKNYNLTKPDGTDLVDIDDLNTNFDIIDRQLKEIAGEAAGKQDPLTYDEKPGIVSTNPVTSRGIYAALQEKQNVLTFDTTPTYRSQNPVTSSGVFSALSNKQNNLTFDDEPTALSLNPVTSAGIRSALLKKQDDLTKVPEVSTLLETDYLFLDRGGTLYKILASAVMIRSGDDDHDGLTTEGGDSLLTEDGVLLSLDTPAEA